MVRKPSLSNIGDNGSCEDPLEAIERARIQLALAIAVEARFTPLEQRRYYLETAGQMQELAKRLRNAGEIKLPSGEQWLQALESIKHLPVEGRARQLCWLFRRILADSE